MKRYLWMIILAVGAWTLMGCESEEKLWERFPWNDEELFNQQFTIDEDGCCILEGANAVDHHTIDIYVKGHGWQPTGIYQIMANGKLSSEDYRESAEDYSTRIYEFLSDEQLKMYYSEEATHDLCFKQQAWSYDDKTCIALRKDKSSQSKADNYMQILKVKPSGEQVYMYAVEKIGSTTDG